MPYKIGVVFDMDGVIVHSNPAHKKAIQIFCANHNQNVSEQFLQNKLYGRTNKEWIPELFGKTSNKKLKALADEKEQMFRDMFIPEKNVVPGIHDFLDTLKKNGIPMAVATSAPKENADYILSRLQIEKYFNLVLDSSHVSTGKPDPEVYIKSADKLGISPSHCIVFEDSVAGVQAGLAAGSVVVGVTTTHSKDELSECHLIINNFSNLDVDALENLISI